jgi:hypothetical protein
MVGEIPCKFVTFLKTSTGMLFTFDIPVSIGNFTWEEINHGSENSGEKSKATSEQTGYSPER